MTLGQGKKKLVWKGKAQCKLFCTHWKILLTKVSEKKLTLNSFCHRWPHKQWNTRHNTDPHGLGMSRSLWVRIITVHVMKWITTKTQLYQYVSLFIITVMKCIIHDKNLPHVSFSLCHLFFITINVLKWLATYKLPLYKDASLLISFITIMKIVWIFHDNKHYIVHVSLSHYELLLLWNKSWEKKPRTATYIYICISLWIMTIIKSNKSWHKLISQEPN